MQKAEARNWPLLIKRPSRSGIDLKSQFMLGVEKEASGHTHEARSFFKKAAERGYVCAVILVDDSLLNDVNPYRVRKDEEEASRLLQSIPEDRKRPPIRVVLSLALRGVRRIAEGKVELEKAAEESPNASKELIRVLITLPDPTGENLAERVHHLEALAANYDVEALQILEKCYASGKWCAKNRERARQLAHRAHKLDASIRMRWNQVESQQISLFPWQLVLCSWQLRLQCGTSGLRSKERFGHLYLGTLVMSSQTCHLMLSRMLRVQ